MTTTAIFSSLLRGSAILAAVIGLSACNALTRLSEVGSGPEISAIQNPTQRPGYQPVSMPMPQAVAPPQNANSLWRPGSRAFFKDQRANQVGDILTVAVTINNENATFRSSLSRSRSAEEGASPFTLMGLENQLTKVLPNGADPSSLWSFGADSANSNAGATGRTETMQVNVAAVITQVLPNGNLVISGRQEIRVNYEMRELHVQGIIRPEDISSANTVTSDKIAEARIYYGGRGTVSDLAQPRYGQQIFDIILPF